MISGLSRGNYYDGHEIATLEEIQEKSLEIKFDNSVARARYMLNETEQKMWLFSVAMYK